ncbi:hypothetical protein [Streptomyces griseoluteus]
MTRSGDALSQGMSALVTGGSRGLGLLIAGQLAGRGCEVTILARDAEELGRAMGCHPHPLRQGHALGSPRTPWRRALNKAGRALNDRAAHRYNQRTPGPPTSA